jgi:tRNA pseudouridine38-40 synthase
MDSPDTSLGKRPAPADATASEPDAKAPRLADSRGASPKRGKAKEKTPPRDKRRGTRTEPRADDAERAPRLPKRQCALLIGFAGTGYSGMQMYVRRCSQADSGR